jgi:archaellum component FlaG (FlaF/FlaG flagellin family)
MLNDVMIMATVKIDIWQTFLIVAFIATVLFIALLVGVLAFIAFAYVQSTPDIGNYTYSVYPAAQAAASISLMQ